MPEPLITSAIIALLVSEGVKLIMSITKRIQRSSCTTPIGHASVDFNDESEESSSSSDEKVVVNVCTHDATSAANDKADSQDDDSDEDS